MCSYGLVAQCLVCRGDLKVNGYFCCNDKCNNYVGNITSVKYRELFDHLCIHQKSNTYETDDDDDANDDSESAPVDNILKTILAISESEYTYSGKYMIQNIRNMFNDKSLDCTGVMNLRDKIRYFRYNISRELFQTLCSDERYSTIDRFDDSVNQNPSFTVKEILNLHFDDDI